MHPFVALMRRYCNDYTNRHELSVCDEIMDPEYTLHMGGHVISGRDDAYKPAAAAQFAQFPGLCLTVNDVVCSGERLALRFSEHGASARHGGARAAWSGIGLYRWDGRRLRENFVEQDYFARRRQLADGRPDPVEPPATAPWDTPAVGPDLAAERVVRAWLDAGDIAATAVSVDDSATGRPTPLLLDVERTDVDDLFSAGPQVAFHAVQCGRPTGADPDFPAADGGEAVLHMAGVVTVERGEVVSGRVVRDRLGLFKRSFTRAGTGDMR